MAYTSQFMKPKRCALTAKEPKAAQPAVNEKLESAMRNLRLAIGADNANAVRDLIEALTERRQ